MVVHSVESLPLRYTVVVGGALVLFALAAGFAVNAPRAQVLPGNNMPQTNCIAPYIRCSQPPPDARADTPPSCSAGMPVWSALPCSYPGSTRASGLCYRCPEDVQTTEAAGTSTTQAVNIDAGCTTVSPFCITDGKVAATFTKCHTTILQGSGIPCADSGTPGFCVSCFQSPVMTSGDTSSSAGSRSSSSTTCTLRAGGSTLSPGAEIPVGPGPLEMYKSGDDCDISMTPPVPEGVDVSGDGFSRTTITITPEARIGDVLLVNVGFRSRRQYRFRVAAIPPMSCVLLANGQRLSWDAEIPIGPDRLVVTREGDCTSRIQWGENIPGISIESTVLPPAPDSDRRERVLNITPRPEATIGQTFSIRVGGNASNTHTYRFRVVAVPPMSTTYGCGGANMQVTPAADSTYSPRESYFNNCENIVPGCYEVQYVSGCMTYGTNSFSVYDSPVTSNVNRGRFDILLGGPGSNVRTMSAPGTFNSYTTAAACEAGNAALPRHASCAVTRTIPIVLG